MIITMAVTLTMIILMITMLVIMMSHLQTLCSPSQCWQVGNKGRLQEIFRQKSKVLYRINKNPPLEQSKKSQKSCREWIKTHPWSRTVPSRRARLPAFFPISDLDFFIRVNGSWEIAMLEEDIVSQYLVHSHLRVEEQKDSSSFFPGREEPSH